MAINFPNNPAVNDTFTVGGTTFTFTGVKWETSAVVEISSDTTPTLGGDLDAATYNINNVGVITATTFSGNLIGNVTGTATTATNAQGLTGDPSIQVTNATVLGNLDVQGTTTTIDTAITEVDSLNVEGNVGIGTDIPGHLLDVYNSAGSDCLRLNVNGSAGGSNKQNAIRFSVDGDVKAHMGLAVDAGRLISGSIANDFCIKGLGSNNILFATNSSEKLRITTAGNVGIGTAVPVTSSGYANLSLAKTNGGQLELKKLSSGRTHYIWGDDNLNIGASYNGGGGDLIVKVDGNNERLRINSSGNVTATGTISDSIGPLRRLGINAHNAATYTLVAGDAGKLVREATNSANITIPQNVFSAGDMISIFNVSSGDNTITQGTGTTLYNTADGATGNRTLATKGVCTIVCTSPNEFIISGSQVS